MIESFLGRSVLGLCFSRQILAASMPSLVRPHASFEVWEGPFDVLGGTYYVRANPHARRKGFCAIHLYWLQDSVWMCFQ